MENQIFEFDTINFDFSDTACVVSSRFHLHHQLSTGHFHLHRCSLGHHLPIECKNIKYFVNKLENINVNLPPPSASMLKMLISSSSLPTKANRCVKICVFVR